MHLALLCPPFPSHVQVFGTLAAALMRRGHQATVVVQEGAETFLPKGVPHVLIPAPDGRSTRALIDQAARPEGILGVLRTVANSAAATDNLCQHLPGAIDSLGVDAIVADQMEPAGGLVARHLGIPYLSLACALPLERDEHIPPPYLDWPYASDEKGLKRNRGGEMVARFLLRGQRQMIRQWAARFGLSDIETLEDCLSPLGTIAQLPQALDYPRKQSPRALVHVGPIREAAAQGALPYEIDPRRPFVFMSLGTLQGQRLSLFRAVARACKKLEVQLLVAHCGGLTPEQASTIDATFVTDFAPQREVLARADICVTHGGQNTVLDALEAGKPLVVIPIAFDQPGIAARVVHHGVGTKLSPRFLTARKAQAAIEKLLSDQNYSARARSVGHAIRASDGLICAVAAIEKLIGPHVGTDRQKLLSTG